MSPRTEIDPGWEWDANVSLSQGIQVGNTIYVSGQLALDADGKMVGGDDMAAQTRQALQNMKTVLAAAGATMADVVKITVFVTDISRISETQPVRAEFFPRPFPTSSAIEISALAFPGFLIEIEGVAVKS